METDADEAEVASMRPRRIRRGNTDVMERTRAQMEALQ
jgi:hypothetical protein